MKKVQAESLFFTPNCFKVLPATYNNRPVEIYYCAMKDEIEIPVRLKKKGAKCIIYYVYTSYWSNSFLLLHFTVFDERAQQRKFLV